jgi:hypothetical protein
MSDEERVDGTELVELDEPGSDERLRDKLREYLAEHKIEEDERPTAEEFLAELESALSGP